MGQICLQILDVFHANTQPHQAVRNTQLGTPLSRHGRMQWAQAALDALGEAAPDFAPRLRPRA